MVEKKQTKPSRSQKGAGARCSKGMEMPTDPMCQARIIQLQGMKGWLETVVRLMGDILPIDMKLYFERGVQMLSDNRAIYYIVSKEDVFNNLMERKEELILIIHSLISSALQQETGSSTSLFINAVSDPGSSISLSYALATDEDVKLPGCDTCLITLEDIEPGKAVKISHPLNDGTDKQFSICLSKQIFEESSIKDAMAANNIWMKHPILREKAYIDLKRIKQFFPDLTEQASQASQALQASQTGGLKLKRTDKKITLHGRERTIYVGKHNKQYVQMNRQYVAVSSLTTHKKASKKRL